MAFGFPSRHLLVPVFTLSLSLAFASQSQAEISPNAMVKAADEFRGLQGSFSFQVKTIVQDGPEKIEQLYSVKVRDAETSLAEQLEPVRAQGRKLLMKGLDMWLFTPQVKKAVRISLQQKLTGDISNGDISRTNYSQDYEAKSVGEDAATSTVVLELTAKDNRVTYHKIKYWLQKGNWKPLKAEFYALSGKLMKIATFGDFKKIEGAERMTKVVISDAIVASKKSMMIYTRQKYEKFPDSLFNKEQMDR